MRAGAAILIPLLFGSAAHGQQVREPTDNELLDTLAIVGAMNRGNVDKNPTWLPF
ncbi:MAG: hypothetical protein JO210_03410 [Acidobacteriaceae bacterium]|nr:hypothetical protein [Acidobacteriaceae bacterium]